MQIVVDIKDKNIADKIIWFLKTFSDKGVKIKKNLNKTASSKDDKHTFDEEYIKEHWREIGMNTHSADIDDNDIKYEAYGSFYAEKYSS